MARKALLDLPICGVSLRLYLARNMQQIGQSAAPSSQIFPIQQIVKKPKLLSACQSFHVRSKSMICAEAALIIAAFNERGWTFAAVLESQRLVITTGLGSGNGRCQRPIMAHRMGRTPPNLFKGLCIGYSPRRGSAGVRSHLGQRILVVHDGSACMRDACVHSGLWEAGFSAQF